MNNTQNTCPPKWPLRLLRFFVKKEYLEEIEGDMEELFHDNLQTLSLKDARLMYSWEIVKLFRPILIKNVRPLFNLSPQGMFKNYFKISIRGLLKNPLNSFINIFGLAVAIGFCVLAYAFARWTYGTDQFHIHKNEVYLATFFASRDGSLQQYGLTPRPLGEMLREDFTHIKKVCRVEDRNVIMKHEEKVFNERIRYVDPEFLEMFTFPLKWGSPSSLADVNSIILSEKMSKKYFGEANPLGETIIVKFDQDSKKAFRITGIAGEFPKSKTIGFNFLINFENFRTSDTTYNFHDWSAFVDATFVQVDDSSNIRSVERQMKKYQLLQNEAVQKDWAITSFAFKPLATLHAQSEYLRDHISRSSSDNFMTVIFLSIIGIFMLALACFNYINIAIVSATKRLKEIGVRKSIGATRLVVIVQFLSENIIITFFALFLGLIIGATAVVPWFEHMNDFSMDFKLTDGMLWIYLPLILLFTGIASGIYPALYISRFQVVGILKGAVKFGNKNPMTRILLGFQLILACILITAGVTFTQNSEYLARRSWGYNQQEVLYAEVQDGRTFEKLSAVMQQNPDVLSISGSKHHLGKSNTTAILHVADHEIEADELDVDPRYLETLGLQLIAGRAFNDHQGSDKQAVIVNELLVKNMDWKNPVGQQFEIDKVRYEVIGVVKDFHSFSFSERIKPMIFRVAAKADYRYFTMKVRPGSALKTYRTLQTQWAKLFPELPFQGQHQEDVWGEYYKEIGNHGSVWRVIAFLATMLAGMGLYGLVTLNVTGRVREFSIRKILGAGLTNIAGNISKQYVLLFAIALAIGAPVSFTLMKLLFDVAYSYHIPVTYDVVLPAIGVLIFVLLATTSTQITKVAKSNPVNGVKAE